MTTYYNLFRRASQPQICCAVPQTEPLPSFLSGRAWVYGGVADETALASAGIRHDIPDWASNHYAFYVFHDRRPERRPLTR
ncbi:MAG: hypothetical protein JOZ66_18350 [Hyphomicrobiales bacterium]|nr:hypothetical protein [Hyphomicrobiales bacterium]